MKIIQLTDSLHILKALFPGKIGTTVPFHNFIMFLEHSVMQCCSRRRRQISVRRKHDTEGRRNGRIEQGLCVPHLCVSVFVCMSQCVLCYVFVLLLQLICAASLCVCSCTAKCKRLHTLRTKSKKDNILIYYKKMPHRCYFTTSNEDSQLEYVKILIVIKTKKSITSLYFPL